MERRPLSTGKRFSKSPFSEDFAGLDPGPVRTTPASSEQASGNCPERTPCRRTLRGSRRQSEAHHAPAWSGFAPSPRLPAVHRPGRVIGSMKIGRRVGGSLRGENSSFAETPPPQPFGGAGDHLGEWSFYKSRGQVLTFNRRSPNAVTGLNLHPPHQRTVLTAPRSQRGDGFNLTRRSQTRGQVLTCTRRSEKLPVDVTKSSPRSKIFSPAR